MIMTTYYAVKYEDAPAVDSVSVCRVTQGKEPAVSLPSDAIHNRKSDHVSCLSGKISPFSDSEPWDTDFSDDEDTSKVSDMGRKRS